MIPAYLERQRFPMLLKTGGEVTAAGLFKMRERRVVILAFGRFENAY